MPQPQRASMKSNKPKEHARAGASPYQVILDRLDAAVILIDCTGLIVALNFAAAALLQLPAGEACGQPIAASPLWMQHIGLERLLEAPKPTEFMLIPQYVRFRISALGDGARLARFMIEARDCSTEHRLRTQLHAMESAQGGRRLASVEELQEELDATVELLDSRLEAYAWENDRLRAELGRKFVLDQEWSLLLAAIPMPVVLLEPIASTPAAARILVWNQSAGRRFHLRGDRNGGVPAERLRLAPADCARLIRAAMQVVNSARPAVLTIEGAQVHLITLRGQVAAIWCDNPNRK